MRYILSVESQKGVIAAQRCSVENQKGAIAVQSLWFIAPFWFSTEHHWSAIAPFWLSADDIYIWYEEKGKYNSWISLINVYLGHIAQTVFGILDSLDSESVSDGNRV